MSDNIWSLGGRIGRWAGFGPYYAMFPVSFAREIIGSYSNPGDVVVDPFCGRGTTNYVAQALGRNSYGCEVNPVGWIYAVTKTSPAKKALDVVRRIEEIGDLREPGDYEAENLFQQWAWCPDVLAFINSARRSLDWKGSKIDRTVAAILLVYLHGKIGGGISNQMRQSKSMSPDYAVRWWQNRQMTAPIIDPVSYLSERVLWRYKKGVFESSVKTKIFFGDARDGLGYYRGEKASLVLTSPPYLGVTNYEYDNWIRLWALGGASLPSWSQAQRYGSREKFTKLINDVFSKLSSNTVESAVIVVRTDSRRFTLEKTAYAIADNWPSHRLVGRRDKPIRPTQTALFGDLTEKPGEVDIIALPPGRPVPKDFFDLETGALF